MHFRRRYFSIVCWLFCCFFLTGFQPQNTILETTKGYVEFKSQAQLEMLSASSKELAGLIDLNKRTFSFKINIRSFQGFNSPLQREHFNENYLESNKFPEASFKGKIIEEVDLSKDGKYQVRTKGIFTIHGVSQERILKNDITVKNHSINIISNFSVLLTDHNIPIPKVVYQKLVNEILVEVNATLLPR